MKYKYITGKVLEIDPKSGWKDGMLLEEIYPDSSFVSGNTVSYTHLTLPTIYSV